MQAVIKNFIPYLSTETIKFVHLINRPITIILLSPFGLTPIYCVSLNSIPQDSLTYLVIGSAFLRYKILDNTYASMTRKVHRS